MKEKDVITSMVKALEKNIEMEFFQYTTREEMEELIQYLKNKLKNC